jgi:hypothetical protein
LVSSSFVPHYDETKSLLNSQPHFCAIGADGEQLRKIVTSRENAKKRGVHFW